MTISEISKKYNLTQDTLRYYEKIGLIPNVPRSKSGIRDYDEETEKWVEFIKCMRNAGLSIETLIEYVTLFKKGNSTIEERKDLLISQKDELIKKIDNMNKTLERLNYKIKIYDEIALGKRKDFFEKP